MKPREQKVEGGVRRRIDPRNYFDAGEVSILRAYFGVEFRRSDPTQESLYADQGDEGEASGPFVSAGTCRPRGW